MADPFYRGNNENAIGAPARVLMAESSYPMVEELAHIISLSTYDPNTTYGWREMGLTSAPTTLGHSVETAEWRSEQFGRFRIVPVDYTATVQTEFMEMTQDIKVLAMMGSEEPSPPSGQTVTYFSALENIPNYRIAVLFRDHLKKIHASVFPNAQWNGDAIQQAIARGEAVRAPVTFNAYVDTDVIDSVSGQACFRVDFDQT